jgi:hypothetical protein
MTMTKLPTHVAFDLLVVEQLHDIIPCDWEEDGGCTRTAHWTMTCPRCGGLDLLCTPHRVNLDEAAAADDDEVYCTGCKFVHLPPLPWRAV